MLTLWKEAPQEVQESAKQPENFEASVLFLFCYGACRNGFDTDKENDAKKS